MTIAQVQKPAPVYGSGATVSNTFAAQPTEGNLLVFRVSAANNVTITADDPSLVQIGTGYETFRRLSVFAKIASAAEASAFSFTLSGSASRWCYAAEYSTTDTWDAVAGSLFDIQFDSTGSASAVSANIGGTTAGSLLVAHGYMADDTDGNQQITVGYGHFEQPAATGAGRRTASADKVASGGGDVATYGRVDAPATDNRLASALAEFTVTVVGDTVTTDAAGYTYGDTITGTTTISAPDECDLTDPEPNTFALVNVQDLGGGLYSADIPNATAALDACLTGAVTLTLGNGVDSATVGLNLDVLAGYTLTTLTSLAGTPSYIDMFPTAAEVGDQFQNNEPRLTLYPDGSFAATGDSAFSAEVVVTSKTGGEITIVTYNFENGALVSAFATGSRNDLLSKIVTKYGGTPTGTNRNELLQNWLDAL